MSKLKLLGVKAPSIYFFASIVLRNEFVRAKLSDKIAYFTFVALVLSGIIWKSLTIIEYIRVSLSTSWNGPAFGAFVFILISSIFAGVEFLIRKNKIFNFCTQSSDSKLNFLLWQVAFQIFFIALFLTIINTIHNYKFTLEAFVCSAILIILSNIVRGIFPIILPNSNSNSNFLFGLRGNKLFNLVPKIGVLSSSFYFWRKNILTFSNLIIIIFLIIGSFLTSIYVQNAFPIIGFMSVIILIFQLNLYDFEPKKLVCDLTLNAAQTRIFFNDTRALVAPYLIMFFVNTLCLYLNLKNDFLYINYAIILFSIWFIWIWQNALNLRGKRRAWISVVQAIIFCVILLFAFVPAGIISMIFWAWHIFNKQYKLNLKGNY